MGFSTKQVHALKRNLDPRFIRNRTSNGRELSYIEGWFAVAQANRIFGFEGWSRETLDARCVLARENRGIFIAVYTAKVRITVHADGATVIREGHGSGEGKGSSPGEVHDIALKAAETDATKRALATFGRPFGLELYRKDKSEPLPEIPLQPAVGGPSVVTRYGLHPDDTTPIPRPSHFYGRRHQSSTKEFFPKGESASGARSSTASASAEQPTDALQGRVDKSQLALAEPKRLRDKAHLKFVASQACLVCGRTPCDPHHLRFAQPRAIGLKVSDEFTVPLCRGHHRELHQVGNETQWWERLRIKPLDIARSLWEQTHLTESCSHPARLKTEEK